MQNDIKRIRELCEKYRTEPKLLLIPSMNMKSQINKTLLDNGIQPLNLSLKTIRELAFNIAEHVIINNNLIKIDFRETADAITDILKTLQEQGSLCFFNKIEITFGICKAISKTVLELIDYGYLVNNINLDQIKNDNKRKDLILIIKEYITWKKSNNYIDHTDISEMAVTVLEEGNVDYVSGYALEACKFSFLEENIINTMNLPGLKPEYKNSKDINTLTSLSVDDVKFFEGYGEYNEVKEVLRRIIQEKIPFDNVLIVTTKVEPYSQLFHQLLQQYTLANDLLPRIKGIPITFNSGLPLLLSSPAKLLMLLLDWVGSDYRSAELINIFSSGMFDIKIDQEDISGDILPYEERFNKQHLINFIKRSGLTWQRHSYKYHFNNQLEYTKQQDYEDKFAEKAAVWLIEFVTDAFEMIPIPDEDGLVEVEVLLDSLKEIVKRYYRVYSEFDGLGLRVTLNELSTSIKGRRVVLNDAIEIIKEYMRDIRIQNESPAPGKMHIASYRHTAWIKRENVFIVGLGADNFPGMALEDPLLLDNERMSPPMLSSQDKINHNIELMTSFLTNITGKLTCSYASYDTVEIRESYPTTLFYKLKEMYPDKITKKVGFVLKDENDFIDEDDYWTYHGVNTGAVFCNDVSCSEIQEKAMWDSTDKPAEVELTATSLTTYMQCKYKYFLKHVLRIRELREEEFDALGWLSALETGNVYHNIFEKFTLDTIKNPNILYDIDTASEHIQKIACSEIAAFEEELPTSSVYHSERQREEILRNVVKFVEYEFSESDNRKARYAEYEFGKEEPVFVDVGDGHVVKVKGKVDRIDEMNDGTVEIIDYKTGSTWTFKDLKSPEEVGINEANAQLALYYLALRELGDIGLSDDSSKNLVANDNFVDVEKINKMSYRFVTAKGNYDIISMPVTYESEDKYRRSFLKVCKEIENGVFPPERGNSTEDASLAVDCKFCNYNEVCYYAYTNVE